jgi:hypothetical protein
LTSAINYDQALRLLDECSIPYAVLDVGDGHRLVVLERGGHALGPFDGEGRSALWLNPAVWESGAAMRRFVADGQWNIGGERLWVAPEIRFTVRDRADFWGSYRLPPDMDPGHYELDADAKAVRLCCESRLDLFNPQDGAAHIAIERSYRALANPLRHLAAKLGEGVTYSGFRHRVRLTLLHDSSPEAEVESWTLAQLIPSGVLVAPCTADVEYEDYYEPVDAEHFHSGCRARCVSLSLAVVATRSVCARLI